MVKLLRLVPDNTQFSFMRFRRVSFPFSAFLSVLSVLFFFYFSMNFGIDFKGGTLLELQATSGVADLASLRETIRKLNIGEAEMQSFGTSADVVMRLGLDRGTEEPQEQRLQKIQKAVEPEYTIRRVEIVGPRVSSELVQSGTLGVVISILAVLIYLSFRFEWQLAVGAVIATLHDLLLTIGFFSITGLEFNMTSIAAILTIVGYSLNDTVVVLDRIREIMRKYKRLPVTDILDISINTTLSRTITTSTTTFLALCALVFFGGEVIKSFSIAMMFGVIIGVYSSIFIAAPVLMYLNLRTE